MQIDELIIEYLTLRKEKNQSIRKQDWNIAADLRDKEIKMSKKIFQIINPGCELIDQYTCIKAIDDYCLKIYNCSISDLLCLKKVIRIKNLNDLGI